MKKIFGWIVFCSLLAYNNSYTQTVQLNQKNDITNSIYFGGEGSLLYFFPGYGAGGYVGVETNFDHPSISLINTLVINYTQFKDLSTKHYNNDPDNMSIFLYYTVGLRSYLGTPYVYIDINIGISTAFGVNGGVFGIGYILAGDLGFNIPLTESLNLQLSAGGGIINGIGGRFKAGLQFKL